MKHSIDTHMRLQEIYERTNKLCLSVWSVKMNSREQEYEAIVKQMSRIDEMGIEVCIVCDLPLE